MNIPTADGYVAVREKDCNAHYFKNWNSARDYLMSVASPEIDYLLYEDFNWQNGGWIVENVGWIDAINFED